MTKITKRLVDSIKPGEKDIIIRDSELKGFMCKITPKGKKVYLLYYRTKDGTERKPSIGVHGAITCEQAREIAMSWLNDNTKGNDPSVNKQKDRKSISIAELSKRYLVEYAEIHKKPSSVKTDRIHLFNDILPKLGNQSLNSISAKDIENFHLSLNFKPISANRCIALISKMLSLAERWGLRSDAGSLCKHIDKYKENKKDRFLSIEEIRNLFEVLKECEKKQN